MEDKDIKFYCQLCGDPQTISPIFITYLGEQIKVCAACSKGRR